MKNRLRIRLFSYIDELCQNLRKINNFLHYFKNESIPISNFYIRVVQKQVDNINENKLKKNTI